VTSVCHVVETWLTVRTISEFCYGTPCSSTIVLVLSELHVLSAQQHTSAPPALLEFPRIKSIICTVFIILISVSAGLYIGLCLNLAIQCEEKWWTIEGSKEGNKKEQNRAESICELLGQ